MTRKFSDLTDDEMWTFIRETMKECASIILRNADGGDDSLDYVEGAVDLLTIVMPFRDDSQPVIDLLEGIFAAKVGDAEHAANLFPWDAIPGFWHEFIQHPDTSDSADYSSYPKGQ